MTRAVKFAVALVAGLGLLTIGASDLVNRTTREWFEKDIALRSQLAIYGVRKEIAAQLARDDRGALVELLTDMTRDERILGAAACVGVTLVAKTRDLPQGIVCADVAPNVPVSADEPSIWARTLTLPSGAVHLTAMPVGDGFVVLVHDLAFIGRREAKTRVFLLSAFGVLAFAAAAVTLIAARLSWRSWNDELRRFMRGLLGGFGGESDAPEFRPLLSDVRALAARFAEQEGSGRWTQERLKQTLHKTLGDEKVVIVANREPYIHEKRDGGVAVLHPASGLVTALEPVMRACSGVWVAHGSGSADRETADRKGRIQVPPGEESYMLRRVWLTREEEAGYYYGFSNEGLWPLCHIAHARPQFRLRDYEQYKKVNQKFADVACEEADGDDPIILVQDYHFALAPLMIRERLPRATILGFWHIPWPNAESFGICPWREEILQGMLGASILGFHTQLHCNHFLDAVDHYLEARIDREQFAVIQQHRPTLVKPYPISIDWPTHALEGVPPVDECRAQIVKELGLAPNALIGVGVDRLDYTKGIEERLLAVERMLERFPSFRGRFSFIQLAAPSRTVIPRYQELNQSVEALATRINERFASGNYRPVILLRSHHEAPTVFRHYRAADVCYVSSLHDGMNLVAKEFVAAREDERGVLVLSHFTGAARELTEALIVNPYDLEQASAALATALTMSPSEQQERMRAMRTVVAELNVYRWAGRMLIDASRLRRKDRLTGRWSEPQKQREEAS